MNTLHLARAYEVAKFSTCADKQVGCVLINVHGEIVSKGYNKVLGQGRCDICLYPHAGIICPAVHAEMAALLDCYSRRAYKAVCTLEPCKECAKALALSGIKEVYYDKHTNPRKSGRNIWNRLVENGVWQQLSISDIND